VLELAGQGRFADVMKDSWSPEVGIVGPNGLRTRGQDFLVWGMDRDLTHGIRQRIRNVVASGDLLIWEAELISPPGDPEHCPPGVVWLQVLRGGRVDQLRLFHPTRAIATA
jgi:hypothetical protein